MTKTTFELTMNCIKIIEKFFTTAPAVADLNDSETAERVDDISNLLCDSSDIEDKDIDRYLDLVYFFYNNNCLLRDIYNLKTDESVKKSLELEYLRFSFLTFSEGSISRITWEAKLFPKKLIKHFIVKDPNHIKYRLRRLGQSAERAPSSLEAFAIETIFKHSLNTDLLPALLKNKVLQEC